MVQDQRKLEDSIVEESETNKENTDHVDNHKAKINTPDHSLTALALKGISTLLSAFAKAGDGEEELGHWLNHQGL